MTNAPAAHQESKWEKIRHALEGAREAIKIWHDMGDRNLPPIVLKTEWEIYEGNAPEMRNLEAAIVLTRQEEQLERSRPEMEPPRMIVGTFRQELQSLLNRSNMEKGSNTPDFILANFLESALTIFDEGVRDRDRWYDITLAPKGPR